MGRDDLSVVARVQNPAFGSRLLWQFGRGYQSERPGELPPLPLHFLVLPLTLHSPTLDLVRSTNLPSGLTKLTAKLAERRERLLAIHERTRVLRGLTLESLAIAASAGLIHVDYASALVRSNDVEVPTPPERLKFHVSSAEKLGRWLSRMPPGQVFSLLQVQP